MKHRLKVVIFPILALSFVLVFAYNNCGSYKPVQNFGESGQGSEKAKPTICRDVPAILPEWKTIDDSLPDGTTTATVTSLATGSNGSLYSTVSGKIGPIGHWLVRQSDDSGATWKTIDHPTDVPSFGGADTSPNAVAVLPGNPDTLIVSGQGHDGAMTQWVTRRSIDGGKTWVTVDNFRFQSTSTANRALVLASSGNTVYALGNVASAGKIQWHMRKSLDRGATWADSGALYSFGAATEMVPRSLAIDTAGALYAAGLAKTATSSQWIVRKSTDQGTTFTDLDQTGGVPFNLTGTPGAGASAVLIEGPRVLVGGYATDAAGRYHLVIRQSVNGGAAWTTADDQTLDTGFSSYRQLFSDAAGRLFAVAQVNGGSSVSRSADAGATWPKFYSTAGTYIAGTYDSTGGVYIGGGRTTSQVVKLSAGYPARFSQTCLGAGAAGDIEHFAPQYVLWSDAAEKKRFLYLPPDSKIDTSDKSAWVFPVGTQIWKDFSRSGKKVETRYFVKQRSGKGLSAWDYVVYKWREDQSDADLFYAGEKNALGTQHDIPATRLCVQCHQGANDMGLGLDALQLSTAPSAGADTGALTLAHLESRDLVTNKYNTVFEIKGTTKARTAMGYIHANCAHCHNPLGTAANIGIGRASDPTKGFNWRHNLDATTLQTENAYKDMIGRDTAITGTNPGLKIIAAGDPSKSRVLHRVSVRTPAGTPAQGDPAYLPDRQMPPIATDEVDPAGHQALRDWVLELTP